MPDPQRLSGAEAIVEVLRNYNVEYIFSSPGSEWPPVWEHLAKQKALELIPEGVEIFTATSATLTASGIAEAKKRGLPGTISSGCRT